jgi:hypothetical protein
MVPSDINSKFRKKASGNRLDFVRPKLGKIKQVILIQLFIYLQANLNFKTIFIF